jgi:glucose-1-phosphate adenylyltransferase
MSHTGRQSANTSNVLSVIMGGGQGTRLFPLTKERAKPAVPLAGKYRLVDIPISNCINSGLRRIYLLTQFNSASLHKHISQSYKFDHFTGGFVEILAAAPTSADTSWYQGTADAVRKNMIHFMNHEWDYLLILSGDQLYRMDFRHIIEQHAETNADITVATIPVGRLEAQSLGIMQIDAARRITRFVEKPKDPALLDSLKLPPEWYAPLGIKGDGEMFPASMGIYVFNRDIIRRLLDNTFTDFGKHIIPNAIKDLRVFSFMFQGYWEDIGTIRAFFDANLDVTNELPRFNFFDMAAPIFSRPRFLPGSKINGAQIDHAVISDGCIINRAVITHSIVGLRTIVGSGAVLNRVIVLGSDYYESLDSIVEHEKAGKPAIGIGTNSRVENTIVDKNARIGNNVVISPIGKPDKVDHPNYYIRDGIVIIPKNGVIPHGMVI